MNKYTPLSESLILEYQNREKERLFNKAKTSNTQIHLFQIDAVMMNLEESVNYLKLYVEAHQRSKRKERLESTECPTCRSTVL
jgi:hypothetical protein